jgi:hypothetical protein
MKREIHEWRVRDSDGSIRYFNAAMTWKGWMFKTTLREEPDWHPIEFPDRALYQELRDVLWSKYQRGRLPYKRIEQIDKILAGFPPPEVTDEEDDDSVVGEERKVLDGEEDDDFELEDEDQPVNPGEKG